MIRIFKRFKDLLDTPSTYTGQAGKVAAVNGAEDGLEFVAAGGGSLLPYIYVRDEKSAGTPGGTHPGGNATRTLNTVVENTITGASLASNQITLPAGTYRIRAFAPTHISKRNRVFLYNITDSVVAIVGDSHYAGAGDPSIDKPELRGKITIASAKVFELRHFGSFSVTYGLGADVSNGQIEIYASIEIWKEA